MRKRVNAVSDLAGRLKDLRDELGLTQHGLAARLSEAWGRKVGQSTLGGWETGRVPEPTTLVELADFYDVDLRWLLTGEGERERRQVPDTQVRLRIIGRIATDDSIDVGALLRATTPASGGDPAAGASAAAAAQREQGPHVPPEQPDRRRRGAGSGGAGE